MATKNTFLEAYKNPKWQEKRLEVMEIVGFECSDCGSKDNTLHVHHTYYEKGKKPWEYPIESLHCLCEDCHKKAQNINTLLKRQLGKIGLQHHIELLGYAVAIEAMWDESTMIDVFDYEFALGVGNCWELKAEEVIDALVEGQIDGWTLDDMRSAKRGVKSSRQRIAEESQQNPSR